MDGTRELSGCPSCGAPAAGPHAQACGATGGGIELRALPRTAGNSAPPPPVRLVREFKGPTSPELLAAPHGDLDKLPGVAQSLAGPVAGAAGQVLRGPGFGRRRRLVALLPMLLWCWLGGLLAVLAVAGW